MTLKDFIYGYYYQGQSHYVGDCGAAISVMLWAPIVFVIILFSLIIGPDNLGWFWFYMFDFSPILLVWGIVCSLYFSFKDKKIRSMGDAYDTPEYARMLKPVTWSLFILTVLDILGSALCLYLTFKPYDRAYEGFPESIIIKNIPLF